MNNHESSVTQVGSGEVTPTAQDRTTSLATRFMGGAGAVVEPPTLDEKPAQVRSDETNFNQENHMLNLQHMLKAPTLDTLAAAWVQAKATEDRARQQRTDIEASIVRLLPGKEEGTASADIAGMKISVSWKLNRKADADALKDDWATLSPGVQSAFTWKPEVSLTHLRALEKVSAIDYAEALHFITTIPAKPSVKVEVKS